MPVARRERTQKKFDMAVAATGALLPLGIMLGPAGFEIVIILTPLVWTAGQ